jgi:hypothetical protein
MSQRKTGTDKMEETLWHEKEKDRHWLEGKDVGTS